MRKILLLLVVAGTCLIPAPRTSEAAIPCGSYCCSGNPTATATSRCMNTPGVWTTCGWYWSQYYCP